MHTRGMQCELWLCLLARAVSPPHSKSTSSEISIWIAGSTPVELQHILVIPIPLFTYHCKLVAQHLDSARNWSISLQIKYGTGMFAFIILLYYLKVYTNKTYTSQERWAMQTIPGMLYCWLKSMILDYSNHVEWTLMHWTQQQTGLLVADALADWP